MPKNSMVDQKHRATRHNAGDEAYDVARGAPCRGQRRAARPPVHTQHQENDDAAVVEYHRPAAQQPGEQVVRPARMGAVVPRSPQQSECEQRAVSDQQVLVELCRAVEDRCRKGIQAASTTLARGEVVRLASIQNMTTTLKAESGAMTCACIRRGQTEFTSRPRSRAWLRNSAPSGRWCRSGRTPSGVTTRLRCTASTIGSMSGAATRRAGRP